MNNSTTTVADLVAHFKKGVPLPEVKSRKGATVVRVDWVLEGQKRMTDAQLARFADAPPPVKGKREA